VPDVPRLYFLGLTWQHTRGSALIGWVKEDAEFIAERIETSQEAKKRGVTQSALAPPEIGAAAEARAKEGE
jgi:putative flavoprotein involved in K+ transport